MGRSEARETAFKLIYELSITNQPNEFSLEMLSEELANDDKKYIRLVYFGIIEKLSFLTGVIEKYSQSFRIDRVYKVDFAILLLAAYEILYVEKIPFQVSVNEAVELAKKYSTDKSYKFINGVLSSIIKDKDSLLGVN